MSNLPPPGSGGPPFQPDQPTTAFNPLPPIAAPAPKKSKRLFIIIGAAVVVVAALVVGGILVFGGGDDGNTVDSHAASGVVEDVTAAANLDKDTHVAALKQCPFDGIDDLADDAPTGFDAAGAADGDDLAVVSQTGQREDPQLLQCVTGNDDGSLRYGVVAASQPPTDLKDFIGRTLTDATAKFEATTSFEGGTLLPFCTKPNEGADVKVICSTVWYDQELMVGIFATGKGISTDITTAWVKTDLDQLVKDLEGADADGVTVTDTAGFDLDSSAASANLDKLIAAANVDGDAGTQAPQTSCPVADLDALLTTAPTGLDQGQVSGLAIDAIIASAADEGDPSLVQCERATQDVTQRYGVFIAKTPPADFNSYVKRSSGVTSVEFGDTTDFRGGTLHAYCGSDNGKVGFCETDWVSDDIQVGIFANFDGVTSDDTTAWLEANVDTLLASIAAGDPTAVTPAGS